MALTRQHARNMLRALLVVLLPASCGFPPWIPYHAECRCMCVDKPCAELELECCDAPGREDHYRRAFSARCNNFGAAHGYFECALIPSERDAGQTVWHPDSACEQPKEGYAWEL